MKLTKVDCLVLNGIAYHAFTISSYMVLSSVSTVPASPGYQLVHTKQRRLARTNRSKVKNLADQQPKRAPPLVTYIIQDGPRSPIQHYKST